MDPGKWAATSDPVAHEYEDVIFSQHVPEGDPPVVDTEAGTFTSGADAGEMDITLTHPIYGTVETRLMVTVQIGAPKESTGAGRTASASSTHAGPDGVRSALISSDGLRALPVDPSRFPGFERPDRFGAVAG